MATVLSPTAPAAPPTVGQDEQYVFFHAGAEASYRRVLAEQPSSSSSSSSSSSFTAIPTVDLADLDSPSLAARRAIGADVRAACSRCGFFYVENHGVSAALIADTMALLARFFALDRDAKMDAHVHKNPAIRGYEPLLETRLDPRTRGDVKEAFTMGDCAVEPEQQQDYGGNKTGGRRPPPPPPPPPPAGITRPQNIWPAAGSPWWRAGLYRYYNEVLPLALKLVRVFALGLGLDESALDGYFRSPITGMRALYYPPTPVDDEGTTTNVGLGAHADFSWLTLVLQDDVPALEVLNQDGLWVDAPPKPGTFVCNVGQYLERQTNGLFPATVHRVRNRSGRARYSLPFFLTMDPDATVEVLDCCRDDGRPPDTAYDAINVGDLYIRRVLPARPKHPTSIRYADVPQDQWSYSMLLS